MIISRLIVPALPSATLELLRSDHKACSIPCTIHRQLHLSPSRREVACGVGVRIQSTKMILLDCICIGGLGRSEEMVSRDERSSKEKANFHGKGDAVLETAHGSCSAYRGTSKK